MLGDSPSPLLYTIGHSNRALEQFTALLIEHGIVQLIDVRTVPRSRAQPHFNREALPESLEAIGIDYAHMPGLGGLRKPARDSINMGWRNESFRGYADYMQTPQFEASLGELIELARQKKTAIMCAEAVPWRCHRSLIADALTARGEAVEHITGPGRARVHKLTPFIRVEGGRITYPHFEE